METNPQWQKADQWLPGRAGGEREAQEGTDTKGHWNFGGVMNIFTILTVVMVSWVLLWVELCPYKTHMLKF